MTSDEAMAKIAETTAARMPGCTTKSEMLWVGSRWWARVEVFGRSGRLAGEHTMSSATPGSASAALARALGVELGS